MSLRIAFVRPRLGMGGAERLVVDAARVLHERGHQVRLFAPDKLQTPQFEEARLPGVGWRRTGAWLPESVLGRLRAPSAILRSGLAGVLARGFKPHVVIADVTAHVVPWIRRVTAAPVVFYCHYPDFLLTPEGARGFGPYAWYRRPLDRLETRGLVCADALLANSEFTAAKIRASIPGLKREAQVVEPGVDPEQFKPTPMNPLGEIRVVVVSRIDPRKNLNLAVDAFAAARRLVNPLLAHRMSLQIAGRYDERWPENRTTLAELKARLIQHDCAGAADFHLSPDDRTVRELVASSRVVLYPPEGEHFGYGPLEAMASERPVIVVNNGGPASTVVDGVTGFLRAASPQGFATAVALCVSDPELSARLGRAGREHVASRFSLSRFGAGLEKVCLETSRAAAHL